LSSSSGGIRLVLRAFDMLLIAHSLRASSKITRGYAQLLWLRIPRHLFEVQVTANKCVTCLSRHMKLSTILFKQISCVDLDQWEALSLSIRGVKARTNRMNPHTCGTSCP
jgi:hypothetical protein